MVTKRIRDTADKADVVITNPIRVAVALKYDKEKMAAPAVVAILSSSSRLRLFGSPPLPPVTFLECRYGDLIFQIKSWALKESNRRR